MIISPQLHNKVIINPNWQGLMWIEPETDPDWWELRLWIRRN